MTAQNDLLQRRRSAWNMLALLIPGQWMSLTVIFWMRFLPPLRPYRFDAEPPSVTAVVIGGAVACSPFLLPRSYFRPRQFESRRFYHTLGVRVFRYFAPDGDFINARVRRYEPTYRAISNRTALREHIAGTYSNERWHLAFFLVGLFTVCYAVQIGEIAFAALLAVLNVAFNLYPVLHQRYKRCRLRKLLVTPEAEVSPDRNRVRIEELPS